MTFGKIERFLTKRIIIIYLVLVLPGVIFFDKRWLILAGLTLGSALGIIRLGVASSMLNRLLRPDKNAAAMTIGPISSAAAATTDGAITAGVFTSADIYDSRSGITPAKSSWYVVKQVLGLLTVLALLAFTAYCDQWLFIGMAAGILILPIIITVNGITEGLGITKNGFGM